jgi:hypothetical protein
MLLISFEDAFSENKFGMSKLNTDVNVASIDEFKPGSEINMNVFRREMPALLRSRIQLSLIQSVASKADRVYRCLAEFEVLPRLRETTAAWDPPVQGVPALSTDTFRTIKKGSSREIESWKLDTVAVNTVACNNECADLQAILLMLFHIDDSQALRPIFNDGDKLIKFVPNIEITPEPEESAPKSKIL